MRWGLIIIIVLVVLWLFAKDIVDGKISKGTVIVAIGSLAAIVVMPELQQSSGTVHDILVYTAVPGMPEYNAASEHNEIIIDSNAESIDPVTGGLQLPALPFVRQIVKQIGNITHLSLSTGATFASLGMGGDTIVDLAFLAISAGELTVRLGMFLGSNLSFIRSILQSGFAGGPDAVAARAAKLLTDAGDAVRTEIRDLFRSGMQMLLEVAGAVLSAIIPDDGGALAVGASWLASIGGAIGSPPWYSALRALYGLVPRAMAEYIEDRSKLQGLLDDTLGAVTSIVQAADIGVIASARDAVANASWKRIALAAIVPSTVAIPFGLSVISQIGPVKNLITSQVAAAKSHTDTVADLMQNALGLLFCSAAVLQNA